MQFRVHLGHGKTGSSYLQAWLALNAAALADRQGVAYPLRSPVSGQEEQAGRASRFSLGNGFILREILEHDQAATLLRAMLPSPGVNGSLLFSGEQLMRSVSTWWPQLLRVAVDAGAEGVSLLLYVRDPLEHALSVYGQMVKAHGFTGSVDEWLSIYRYSEELDRGLAVVQTLGAGALPVTLTVHNYSRAPALALSQLQAWLGLESGDAPPWRFPVHRRVNRSLDSQELRALCLCNALLGERAGRIGIRLVNDLPDHLGPAPPQPSRASRLAFRNRLAPIVERINARLPTPSRLQLEIDPEREVGAEAEAELELCSAGEEPIVLSPEQLRLIVEELLMLGSDPADGCR